jgi:putative phosphoribosyl transferase
VEAVQIRHPDSGSLTNGQEASRREVVIPPRALRGSLRVPAHATSIVLFVHGSGSSRFSPRNVAVAEALNRHGIATLLFDLLTPKEDTDRANRFDIALLAQRLNDAIQWKQRHRPLAALPLGLFGASTGAAAALVAAARMPESVLAVVSRGGRPDLAGDALPDVRAPTLLIVGGADYDVITLNEDALRDLTCVKALKIVPRATHLFEEPGTLEQVMDLAALWFERHLLPQEG